jgi:hypothetical protein
MTTAFMTALFRVYGAYIVAFGLLAITVAATGFRRGNGWDGGRYVPPPQLLPSSV